MEEAKKSFYKSILGDTKRTIDAIQKFIEKKPSEEEKFSYEDSMPADSVNRIINSIADKDTADDIQKIIENL